MSIYEILKEALIRVTAAVLIVPVAVLLIPCILICGANNEMVKFKITT